MRARAGSTDTSWIPQRCLAHGLPAGCQKPAWALSCSDDQRQQSVGLDYSIWRSGWWRAPGPAARERSPARPDRPRPLPAGRPSVARGTVAADPPLTVGRGNAPARVDRLTDQAAASELEPSSAPTARPSAELYTNIPDTSTGGYTALQTATSAELALLRKFDAPPYVDPAAAGSIPFLDFGNKHVQHRGQLQPAGPVRAELEHDRDRPEQPEQHGGQVRGRDGELHHGRDLLYDG